MSNSSAKKQRMKQLREGKRNPEHQRLTWNGLLPVQKKTETLQERITKIENKHKKWNPSGYAEDSIFLWSYDGLTRDR